MDNFGDRYLALLRGINVGGKNIIAKQDLKACFEDLGFSNVRTYIQSGNILFRSSSEKSDDLTSKVERGLAKRFGYDARVVVLSRDQYRQAVDSAPKAWGKDEDLRHNAMFTLASITPDNFLARLPAPRQEIEMVSAGRNVVFWSVSKTQASRSSIAKLTKEAVYKEVTIRNHNTVFKLLELFEEI